MLNYLFNLEVQSLETIKINQLPFGQDLLKPADYINFEEKKKKKLNPIFQFYWTICSKQG